MRKYVIAGVSDRGLPEHAITRRRIPEDQKQEWEFTDQAGWEITEIYRAHTYDSLEEAAADQITGTTGFWNIHKVFAIEYIGLPEEMDDTEGTYIIAMVSKSGLPAFVITGDFTTESDGRANLHVSSISGGKVYRNRDEIEADPVTKTANFWNAQKIFKVDLIGGPKGDSNGN